ncbi:MAG TPA: hypothetical protein VK327_11425 [Candidatus Paceibacterota bacterium]|nr:hypothetical protein [Candidatus Paceibacterota bacterium]
MNRLTSQEKTVLIVVLGLLLMGLAVKTYRTAHPPVRLEQSAETTKTAGEQAKN